MDFVSPVLDFASLIRNCVGYRADKLRHLPQNLNSLRTAMEKLNRVCKDVKERVEREESLKKKRTHVVGGWIQSVEDKEDKVNKLLAEGEEEIQKKCLGTCCPKNCRASYKLAKMVLEEIVAVDALQTEGNNFQEVVVPLPSPQVIERPLEKPVGLDSPFDKVWRSLEDEQVGTIGIYGTGGVGKTTLLKKINNKFLESSHDFDIVIWVVVSKPANLQRVQETILSRLQIPDDRWKNWSEEEKAATIYKVLKTQKFVLLLDDIWERLDLLRVGIPLFNDRNKSKIVLTTRDEGVCRDMQAQKCVKVECLASEEAVTLFQSKVGEDTLYSHPDIPRLSEKVAKMCEGLPLALIVIARAMARAKTPEEWERKMEILRDDPHKVRGTENDLYGVLALSYDSLPDEAIKSCFLYCSLFPEDYEISFRNLMRLWIGEGFLDECNRIQGQESIDSLKDACLLENARFKNEEEYLKMHDVIRGMALWLAREKGKKKNKFVMKDGVRLIGDQEVEKWKDAKRISLWNTSIEELREPEPPHFRNTETFLFSSGERMKSFPSGFFTHMPVIRVLDLSNNDKLMELLVEIGNLVTLQYLNLSRTKIEKLPVELKNLKKLRCLILDGMRSLKPLPSQMVSSLSSLQLFSSSKTPIRGDGEITLLKELEQLEHINDVSIELGEVLSTQILLNSHKLQRSTRRLTLNGCEGMNLVQLPPYVEELYLSYCEELDYVQINFEEEVVPSKFPWQQCSNHLRSVDIEMCEGLVNMTCLIYAPNLQFLSLSYCSFMTNVIEDEWSEGSEWCEGSDQIEPDLDVFSRLISLTLFSMPNLRSICGRALPFPSLRHISVIDCQFLNKLPFDSNTGMSKKLETIWGEREWWDGLKWEDQTIKHNLTPYFQRRL